MKIIFMGSSDFAIPTLIKLKESNHQIIKIITQPDRPKGRKNKLSQSTIKKFAINHGYQILQPKKINESNFISKLKTLSPDVFVVVSFGEILCKKLLTIPKKGTINLHPSLIPSYRGATPIQSVIINNEKITGITTMLMNSGTDTGDILLKKQINIKPFETFSSLHDRLSEIGSKLLLETLDKLKNNSLNPIPQDSSKATFTSTFKKTDGEINWNQHADKIEAFIRGMNPWPGTFTFYKNKRLKIIKSTIVKLKHNEKPGTIIKVQESLYIATNKHVISILELQRDSKKQLPIKQFLRGYPFLNGEILGKHQKNNKNIS